MEVSYKELTFILAVTICMHSIPWCDLVIPPPSQITAVKFDQVREIFTDSFYGSRRGLFNMSWDRPDGMLATLPF